jgi:cytochrome b
LFKDWQLGWFIRGGAGVAPPAACGQWRDNVENWRKAMNESQTVKVWDVFIRVFHWALVGAFATAYLSAEDFESVHVWAGYAVLGLVAARLLWGVIGTEHARFANFVRSPVAAFRYVVDVVAGRARRFIGHNPAGAAMIVLMLVTLIALTISGVALYGADEGQGPLAGMLAGSGEEVEHLLEEVHEFLANLMLAFIAIHVVGVLVESLVHHESLVRSMFTGRKRA